MSLYLNVLLTCTLKNVFIATHGVIILINYFALSSTSTSKVSENLKTVWHLDITAMFSHLHGTTLLALAADITRNYFRLCSSINLDAKANTLFVHRLCFYCRFQITSRIRLFLQPNVGLTDLTYHEAMETRTNHVLMYSRRNNILTKVVVFCVVTWDIYNVEMSLQFRLHSLSVVSTVLRCCHLSHL